MLTTHQRMRSQSDTAVDVKNKRAMVVVVANKSKRALAVEGTSTVVDDVRRTRDMVAAEETSTAVAEETNTVVDVVRRMRVTVAAEAEMNMVGADKKRALEVGEVEVNTVGVDVSKSEKALEEVLVLAARNAVVVMAKKKSACQVDLVMTRDAVEEVMENVVSDEMMRKMRVVAVGKQARALTESIERRMITC